jgi:PAS domain-containing protein
MWIFDHGSGVVVAANDAAVGAYGYTREELLRCSVHEIFPSTTSAAGPVPTSYVEVSPRTGTCTQLRKGGAPFDADVAILQTQYAGRAATIVVANPVPRRITNEPEGV